MGRAREFEFMQGDVKFEQGIAMNYHQTSMGVRFCARGHDKNCKGLSFKCMGRAKFCKGLTKCAREFHVLLNISATTEYFLTRFVSA